MKDDPPVKKLPPGYAWGYGDRGSFDGMAQKDPYDGGKISTSYDECEHEFKASDWKGPGRIEGGYHWKKIKFYYGDNDAD